MPRSFYSSWLQLIIKMIANQWPPYCALLLSNIIRFIWLLTLFSLAITLSLFITYRCNARNVTLMCKRMYTALKYKRDQPPKYKIFSIHNVSKLILRSWAKYPLTFLACCSVFLITGAMKKYSIIVGGKKELNFSFNLFYTILCSQ